mmetsp:Transcript_2066/g.6147  ORF Transcript_2066/g.6147 Transcript_2066/m.6147 type:complete len:317 (-) Transcript_2066:38-988(-)
MPVDYSKFDDIKDSDEDEPPPVQSKKPEPPKADKTAKCANCGAKAPPAGGALKKCTVCRKVAYCSAGCQRDDWRFHKRVCSKPADKKKKDEPSKPKEPRKKKAPAKVESSSDDDDDGKPITWYKHRETKLPDSNVVHTKLETAPAAPEKSTSEGSAWNTAGTWEEKDVLPAVKAGIEAALTPRSVPSRDFGAGVVEFRKVKGVDGDASVGVIRGKKRHIVDLSVEISFAVRVGGSSRDYSGVLELKEYTADAVTDGCECALKFADEKSLPPGLVDTVRKALGASACTVRPTDAPATFAEACLRALNEGFIPTLLAL